MDYESNKGELTPEWWLWFGGIEMSEKPFILDFDSNEHAVLEPNHDKLPFKFHEKLVYAFVPKEDIDNFLKQVPGV